MGDIGGTPWRGAAGAAPVSPVRRGQVGACVRAAPGFRSCP